MTTLFKTGILYVMTPECYDRYFVDFDFLHGACMKATLSKVLGLAIVLGSLTVKVPQILKIIQNKSGEGISLTGSILELSACTSFFAYSYLRQFPFSGRSKMVKAHGIVRKLEEVRLCSEEKIFEGRSLSWLTDHPYEGNLTTADGGEAETTV